MIEKHLSTKLFSECTYREVLSGEILGNLKDVESWSEAVRIALGLTDALISELSNSLPENKDTEVCEWRFDATPESERYTTDCGATFDYFINPVADNDFKFCPYCSRPIREVGEKPPEPTKVYLTKDTPIGTRFRVIMYRNGNFPSQNFQGVEVIKSHVSDCVVTESKRRVAYNAQIEFLPEGDKK